MGSEILQLFAGFESHRFAGRDSHLDTGLGVAAHTTLAIADLEDTEPAKFDALTLAESVFHLLEDDLYGMSCLDPRNVRGLCNAIDEVGFYHVSGGAASECSSGFCGVSTERVGWMILGPLFAGGGRLASPLALHYAPFKGAGGAAAKASNEIEMEICQAHGATVSIDQ